MKLIKNIILFSILGFFIWGDTAFTSGSKDVAIILKSKGTVKIRTAKPKKWKIARRGMRLNSGDIVKTGDNALVAIMFTDDKSLLKIRENSTIAVQGKRKKASIAKRLFIFI